MKTIATTLISASLLAAGAAQASTIKTAGQAVSLCKNFAQENHQNYVSSKSKNIKQTRAGYTVKLRVKSESGSELIECLVAKDGTLDYQYTEKSDANRGDLATK